MATAAQEPLLQHHEQHSADASILDAEGDAVLLGSLGTPMPMGQSHVASVNASDSSLPWTTSVLSDPTRNAAHTHSGFNRKLGRLLQRAEWVQRYLEGLYSVLLVNVSLVCVILLLMKITNNEVFTDWVPKDHRYHFDSLANWHLQIANMMLVLSYAMHNFLLLRLCLALACAMFVAYAITAPDGVMLDMAFFNFLMCLLNIRHAASLLYERRYIEFAPHLEQVFDAVFAEFMTRTEFDRVAASALVRREGSDSTLKVAGDLVTSLCVIVSGTVGVYNRAGQKINQYGPNEFIEAPEWNQVLDLNPEGLRFRVTFRTSSDIVYIKWPRETLTDLLQSNTGIFSALRAILGIQTSRLWLRSIELKDNPPQQAEPKMHYALAPIAAES